ncbi:hypothetical protein LINPERHAP1_LOCUS19118 [Linum perenne]
MSGGKMNSYGSSPIRFRKDDIADVDARTEYFLLVPIFWEQPRPLAYVQEALDKLWKCQDDYADATLEVAEADVDGGGSNVNLNDTLDENKGIFGLVDGCFGASRSIDDFEKIGSNSEIPTDQEFGLADLDENTERVKIVPDIIATLERPEHTNFMSREEPFTSGPDAARNEDNGKLLDTEVEEASLEWPQTNK